MISKNDLLLLLTELEDKGLDVSAMTQKLFSTSSIPLDVVKFINDIMEQNGITDKIANDFAAYSIEEGRDSIVEEDKKLEEEYSDKDQYIETSNDDELAPAEDKAHTEEEIAAINPQREEEEDFDAEDDSMEIVTDKKEIISAKSKTGQDLYYEVDVDGKKKRVSKEYALQHMDAQV